MMRRMKGGISATGGAGKLKLGIRAREHVALEWPRSVLKLGNMTSLANPNKQLKTYTRRRRWRLADGPGAIAAATPAAALTTTEKYRERETLGQQAIGCLAPGPRT
jgi:hypothetical protein